MPRRAVLPVVLALLLTGALVGPIAPVASASYPVLPASDGGGMLENLSAPVLAAGSSGPLGIVVANPLNATMRTVVLSLAIYRFDPYPGGDPIAPPSPGSPTLSGTGSNGSGATILLPDLPVGGRDPIDGPRTITANAPGGAPPGTFLVRFELEFTVGASDYRFASRGFFTDAEWANATRGPNGTPTLNLSRLGVSGVLPETAIEVAAPSITPLLVALVAGALLLAAAGGYAAFRRGPGSRSGTRPRPRPQSAPRAFGASERSEGD